MADLYSPGLTGPNQMTIPSENAGNGVPRHVAAEGKRYLDKDTDVHWIMKNGVWTEYLD